MKKSKRLPTFNRLYAFLLSLLLATIILSVSLFAVELKTSIEKDQQHAATQSTQLAEYIDNQLASSTQLAYLLSRSDPLIQYQINRISSPLDAVSALRLSDQLIDFLSVETLANRFSGNVDIAFPDDKLLISQTSSGVPFDWHETIYYNHWRLITKNHHDYLTYQCNSYNRAVKASAGEFPFVIRILIPLKTLLQSADVTDAIAYLQLPSGHAITAKKMPQTINLPAATRNHYLASSVTIPTATSIDQQKLNSIDLQVGVAVINKNFFADHLPFLFVCILTAVTFALIGIMTLLVIHRRLEHPINVLTRGMHEYQAGHYDYRIQETDLNEFQGLIDQLNYTGSTIENLIATNYQQQIDLQEEKIKQLRLQINPHFLYNCLSFIDSAGQLGLTEEIHQMSTALSAYYRYVLKSTANTVSLHDELNNITKYMQIFKLRTERLTYHIELAPIIQDVMIPTLSLQPIIENAIKYGLEKSTNEHFEITITADIISRARVQIMITNNGPLLDNTTRKTINQRIHATTTASTHIGLENIYHRLQILYGPESDVFLTIDTQQHQTTIVIFPMEEPL